MTIGHQHLSLHLYWLDTKITAYHSRKPFSHPISYVAGQDLQDHHVFQQPKILLFSILLRAGKMTRHVLEVLQKDDDTGSIFGRSTWRGFWRAISLFSASWRNADRSLQDKDVTRGSSWICGRISLTQSSGVLSKFISQKKWQSVRAKTYSCSGSNSSI